MVDARVHLTKYSNQVLGVVKAKYDLKDKSEALNRFIELHGREEFEPVVRDDYVKKILKIEEEHYKKHGHRKMTDKQLDTLFGK